MGTKIEMEFVIRELNYKETRKLLADGKTASKHGHELRAQGGDGGSKFSLIMPVGFKGFNEKDVVKLTIEVSQTKLEDFSGWKEKETKPKKSVKEKLAAPKLDK